MSLDALYADDIEAGIQRKLANPGPGPGASFSTMSALAAGMRGVPAAGLEVLGTALDLGGLTKDTSVYLGPQGGPAVPGSFISIAGGDTLRGRAQDLAPDAATAHVADQVLFGFTRVGSKVVAANAVAGPAGAAALLFGEGTNTAYRNLKAKGIDEETALKVGAVEGAGQAAAMIPMAGPTIKATVGLSLAAGPGTFMAQEALSRKILAEAGYQNEASRHDPLDPVGLTISTLLPGVFGGAHAVRLARGNAAPTLAGVVESMESSGKRYGADGQLLTSPKGAQGEMQVMPGTARDPGFGVVPAKDGSPEELARVGRDYLEAMHSRYGEPDQALAAYNAGPGAVDKAMAAHGADWLAHMPEETQAYVKKGMAKLGDETVAHAAADPEAVDAARVRTTQDALYRSMPDHLEAPAEVMRASDEISAGRLPLVEPAPVVDAFPERPPITGADLVGKGYEELDAMYLQALEHNKAVSLEGIRRFFGKQQAQEMASLSLRKIDNWLNKHETVESSDWMQARYLNEDLIKEHRNAVNDFDIESPEALGRSIGLSARRVDAPGFFETPEGGTFANALRYAKEQGWDLDKVMAGMRERSADWAGDDAPGLFSRLFKQAVEPRPALPQPQAAVREAIAAPMTRSEGTNALPPQDSVTVVPEPAAKPAAEKEGTASPESQRATQLAAESPDMLVTLPGSDTPVKLADALRLAREQHAQDMGDTNLVKAALECALSFGA